VVSFKPLLAGKAELTQLRYPLFGSFKLDGIRAVSLPERGLVSRKLIAIPNHHVREALSQPKFLHLDGELVAGEAHADDAYRVTMSAVMTEGGTPQVTFWVFDHFETPDHPFDKRYGRLSRRVVEAAPGVFVARLTQQLLSSESEVLAYEELALSLGYEGVMLRDPTGAYKFGRSTSREGNLLKLKRFEDSEALVLGLVEQKHNANEATINELGRTKRSSHKANKIPKGTTGALQVRDVKTGVEFEIGTGLDDMTRAAFWEKPPVGQIIKYKFQPTGVKDKPRFPVFLGLRDRRD
jgi:DNA ligase-1